MALTGAFLFGWIFLHMVGNLKLYLGPEHMNEYAKWLRVMGAPAMRFPGTFVTAASGGSGEVLEPPSFLRS